MGIGQAIDKSRSIDTDQAYHTPRTRVCAISGRPSRRIRNVRAAQGASMPYVRGIIYIYTYIIYVCIYVLYIERYSAYQLHNLQNARYRSEIVQIKANCAPEAAAIGGWIGTAWWPCGCCSCALHGNNSFYHFAVVPFAFVAGIN